jgi:hypothetical protein
VDCFNHENQGTRSTVDERQSHFPKQTVSFISFSTELSVRSAKAIITESLMSAVIRSVFVHSNVVCFTIIFRTRAMVLELAAATAPETFEA